MDLQLAAAAPHTLLPLHLSDPSAEGSRGVGLAPRGWTLSRSDIQGSVALEQGDRGPAVEHKKLEDASGVTGSLRGRAAIGKQQQQQQQQQMLREGQAAMRGGGARRSFERKTKKISVAAREACEDEQP